MGNEYQQIDPRVIEEEKKERKKRKEEEEKKEDLKKKIFQSDVSFTSGRAESCKRDLE